MEISLTKNEFDHIYCSVRNVFTQVVKANSLLNNIGSDRNMNDEKELYIYVKLLKDFKSYFCLDGFNTDSYPNILSVKDILRIHNRALEINSNIRKNIL